MKLPSWLNPPFWWSWPAWTSPVVEAVSGFLCLVLGALGALIVRRATGGFADPVDFTALATAIAAGLGAFYEAVLDPNKWSWDDMLQRLCGIVFAAELLLRLVS